LLDTIETGSGVKALTIEGEYGSGKTYLLKWIETEAFLHRRIKSFFFDNPGVQFYDLANSLLRQIGRYELSKTLWEFIKPEIGPLQTSLFTSKDEFIAWLEAIKRNKKQTEAKNAAGKAIRASGITEDEEIAFRLAKIMVETIDKPFFEYRDFIAGRKDALVAEKEEARYFSAIIKTLGLTSSAEGIAFLLDEFEEISLQKRLSRKQAYDYLATLKRLINVAHKQHFWLVVAMTPQAAEISRQIEPSLWDRFTGQGEYQFQIPELTSAQATKLLFHRLEEAQIKKDEKSIIWPFIHNIVEYMKPVNYSSPRRLVKIAFYALAEAQNDENIELPLNGTFIKNIEEKVYPSGEN